MQPSRVQQDAQSIDRLRASTKSYAGLYERVDPFGEPQQRRAVGAVQRKLVASVKHCVAQLRKTTFDKAALEKAEAAERPEGIVVADRD